MVDCMHAGLELTVLPTKIIQKTTKQEKTCKTCQGQKIKEIFGNMLLAKAGRPGSERTSCTISL